MWDIGHKERAVCITHINYVHVCHCSCHRGLEQFLRKFPEEVNSPKGDDCHTALHIAAANDHLDIVCLLAETVGSRVSCDQVKISCDKPLCGKVVM